MLLSCTLNVMHWPKQQFSSMQPLCLRLLPCSFLSEILDCMFHELEAGPFNTAEKNNKIVLFSLLVNALVNTCIGISLNMFLCAHAHSELKVKYSELTEIRFSGLEVLSCPAQSKLTQCLEIKPVKHLYQSCHSHFRGGSTFKIFTSVQITHRGEGVK